MKNVTKIPHNGNGHGNGHDEAARYQLSRTFTEITQTVVSSVVSTPCRLIDVLEHHPDENGLFTIRETEFHGTSAGSVSVQHIRLRRHELARLHTVLGTILRDEPGLSKESKERHAEKRV